MQLPQEEQQAYCQENFPSAWRNTESGDWEIAFYSENVYHYNLPDIQQRAVGEYLKVNGYPFYRVVDRTGNILDIEVPNLGCFFKISCISLVLSRLARISKIHKKKGG